MKGRLKCSFSLRGCFIHGSIFSASDSQIGNRMGFNKRVVFITKWLFSQHLIFAVGT